MIIVPLLAPSVKSVTEPRQQPKKIKNQGSTLWFPVSCAIGRQQTNFGGGLGEREAKRSLPQPARIGNADPQSAGNLRIRRPWPLQCMAANGRRQDARQQPNAGSACRQQPGAGSACRQQVGAGTACRQQVEPGTARWGSTACPGRFALSPFEKQSYTQSVRKVLSRRGWLPNAFGTVLQPRRASTVFSIRLRSTGSSASAHRRQPSPSG